MTSKKTKQATLVELTDFLDRLDAAGIPYDMSSVHEGAVLVGVSQPGERWEIEFDAEGGVEVEVLKNEGEVYDFDKVEELFERHAVD